jgi:hypothetical protein
MISDVDDIVEAIVYLTEARHVTGGCRTWTQVRTTENGKQRRNQTCGRGH